MTAIYSPLTTNHSLSTTDGSRRLASKVLAVALGLLALALFYLWELSKATGFTYSHWGPLGGSAGNDYDEGAYVISAQLLLKGYPLFHAVFSAQPAFFLPSLAAVVRAVGNPVAAGHIYEALCGVAALLGVFWMGWTAYRPPAGALALALLAVSPGFLLYAHAVEAEMPMLGLCTLAVAAAQAYYLTRRRAMAALCGLLLMAGTEMKLLSVVVALPLALLLLGGAWRGYRAGRPRRALLLDLLAFALCLVAPALVVLGLLAPADQWQQVVTFHLAASRALPYNAADNVRALTVFLGYDPGLLLLALAGAIFVVVSSQLSVVRRYADPLTTDYCLLTTARYLTLVYALWFLSTLLFLWRYHPLLQHQFVPLLPPLALLGAALVAPEGRRQKAEGRRQKAEGRRQRAEGRGQKAEGSEAQAYVSPAIGTGLGDRHALRFLPAAYRLLPALVYLGLLVFRTLPIDGYLFKPAVTPGRAQLGALLDRTTRPDDFVVCDDPMVALGAHRLLAPGLEDPSLVRTEAGYLTAAQAEAITLRYHVAAIVASRPMFVIRLPAYLAWAQQHYRRVPSPVPAAQVFLRR